MELAWCALQGSQRLHDPCKQPVKVLTWPTAVKPFLPRDVRSLQRRQRAPRAGLAEDCHVGPGDAVLRSLVAGELLVLTLAALVELCLNCRGSARKVISREFRLE